MDASSPLPAAVAAAATSSCTTKATATFSPSLAPALAASSFRTASATAASSPSLVSATMASSPLVASAMAASSPRAVSSSTAVASRLAALGKVIASSRGGPAKIAASSRVGLNKAASSRVADPTTTSSPRIAPTMAASSLDVDAPSLRVMAEAQDGQEEPPLMGLPTDCGENLSKKKRSKRNNQETGKENENLKRTKLDGQSKKAVKTSKGRASSSTTLSRQVRSPGVNVLMSTPMASADCSPSQVRMRSLSPTTCPSSIPACCTVHFPSPNRPPLPPRAPRGTKRKRRRLTSKVWFHAVPIYQDGNLLEGKLVFIVCCGKMPCPSHDTYVCFIALASDQLTSCVPCSFFGPDATSVLQSIRFSHFLIYGCDCVITRCSSWCQI